MAIKIVEEEIKNPEEREPPGNVIFTYIPEKSSGESLQNFVLQQLQNSGIGRIDGHITSNEEKVDASHDENLNLYIDRHAADEIIEHCAIMAKKGLEALGFLVGDLYIWKGERYSVVHEIVTGELESTAVSVKFRRDEFENLFDKLDEIEYDYVLIGWYHSHPGYTSFMSSIDMDTQSRMFNREFHVALVIDPINLEFKAFRISNGKCIEVPYAVFEE